MATDDFDANAAAADLEKLEQNLARIEELTKRLSAAVTRRRNISPSLMGPGQDLYMKAAAAYLAEMAQNPAKLIERQAAFWGKSLRNYLEVQTRLTQAEAEPEPQPKPTDRRFANPLWDSNPFFHLVKEQYLAGAEAMRETVQDLEAMAPQDRDRLAYFNQQIIDMMAPTNFLATNPDALERARATNGQSLVDGLENLVADLEANNGELIVNLADRKAFKLGENIATTPGDVVFRNRMFELIQYKPTTDEVYELPLIIFPPWINKFYVLDLKPQNSFVQWAVAQGFTVFVVSWVNPDASYADASLSTYIEEGYLAAMAEVKAICGTDKVNTIGYCIAGTTLSATLGVMDKRRDKSVNSATFFTTLTDFSEPGEVGMYLANDFVDALEEDMAQNGVLESFIMARTFSYLRANDLIYAPAIKSYMMGEAPPAFDLLFWNGDGTNLPAAMATEYLRRLCQGNALAGEGLEVCGTRVSLKDVKVPLMAIGCETDHIAPWAASYEGVQKMGSKDKTFVMSESGHIAGIVNPPSKNKYGHFTNPEQGLTAADWRAGADRHEGSWWPRWAGWLAKRSGAKIAARPTGDKAHPALCPAPGTYVVRKDPA